MSWTSAKISAQKGQGGICLFGYPINVCIPAETSMERETQVFSRVNSVQNLAVDTVVRKKWKSPICDPQNLTYPD